MQLLKKKWKNASSRWEELDREFGRGQIIFTGIQRRLIIPEGRKHFKIDDGRSYVRGWTTTRQLNSMAQEGLIDRNQEIFVLFKSAPTLEGVVSTLEKLSGGIALTDIENASGLID